ncbi:MAG: hypothetical protein HDT24_05155 [Ruminococcus sp.]|nr:hypothetical protein [Ruminococcus sp.]
MKFKRSEHSRFIQWLDRTAEKNPLMWLPCVVLIALVLAAEHIAEYAKITYLHRNTEKIVKEMPQLEKKPFALRAVAVTLTAAFSLMLVPVTSFDAFGEEYDHITEQAAFNEISEAEETSAADETTVPEEPFVPVETTISEEVITPEETTVPEEVIAPEETTVPEEPTYPEEPAFSAEEIVYDEGINPLAICAVHNYHTTWDWDNDYHKRTCAVCGYTETAKHNMVVTSITQPTLTTGGTRYNKCTVCPYTRIDSLPPLGNHDHRIKETWDYDSNSHWHGCVNPTCGATENFDAHTFGEWQYYTGSYHRQKCTICNYYDIELHDFEWKKDGDSHYEECKVCHTKRNESAHSFKTEYDDTKHWQQCSVSGCGYTKGEAAHTLSTDWQTTASTHRKGCTECGYSTESAPHNLSWNYNDEGEHWQFCSVCGWESAKVLHNLLWQHDDFGEYGQHWQECVCGYETGWGEHDFNDWEYREDENDHWYECIDCGLRIDVEEHDYKWDFLDSEHWRVCKECGKRIDVGEHVYKLEHNDTEHWEECVCGKTRSVEIHHFAEGIYTLDEDGETPVKRYYCTSFCGYYYDEPITHTHTPEDEWKHDDSEHWHECISCGKPVDPAKHDYTVKVTLQPTETEKGTRVHTCKVCGYSYSEAIPELEHTHTFDTEWHKDKTDHWHECTSCGEKTDIAAHVSDGGTVTIQPTSASAGVRTYTCTVCGYIIRTETLPPIQNDSVSVYYPSAAAEAPLRLPYVTNASDIRGWTNIAAYINASPNDVIIPITMNGEDELPKEIADCIMNRDVTLRIDIGGGPVWTVNGLDVTEPQTVNMRVSERSNKIPANVIDYIVSEFEPKEYRLYHSGDFGFRAELTLNVGKKYNDYYAVLYHYNTKTKQLEFVDESYVADKQVTFELTHASYYAVAFSSIPMYDDVSSGAGVFENSVPFETSAMPETSGVTLPAAKLPQITKYSNKKRRYRILRKRRLDDLVFVF